MVLYALLGEGSAAISIDTLAGELKSLLRNYEGLSLEYEQLPFAERESLALRWGNWVVRIAYEEGAEVREDSQEISRILGAAAPPQLADIDKRIRAVFSHDETREYTDQMVDLMEFLCRIKGAIVFDPQQKNIMQPGEDLESNRNHQ